MGGFGERKEKHMYNFEYVDRSIWTPVKENIECILHEVQNLVRHQFTFSYTFIGSSSRNMITCDFSSNIGYDFDVNIYINDDENQYSAKEQKNIIMNALNQIAWRYGYSYCEDSTRVITIKVKERLNSRILHSCDIAIVHHYTDTKGEKKQEYVRFNKEKHTYTWDDQPKKNNLEKKIFWLKKHSLWNEVRDTYLYKKNRNTNPNKHSRSLFAETINEVCIQNCYIQQRKNGGDDRRKK